MVAKVEAKQLRWLQRIWCPASSLQPPGGHQVSGRAPPCPPRHHGHSFPGQAGQACYIWIATTECWVREQPGTTAAGRLSTSTTHLLLHQPSPQQGHHQGGGQHTLQCWYQADQQGGAPLHQLHRAHSGSSGGLVTRGITSGAVTSHKQSEEMWRRRHYSHHIAVFSAMGQGLGWILPHLTTLIIQDLVLVPGSGQGVKQPWAG